MRVDASRTHTRASSPSCQANSRSPILPKTSPCSPVTLVLKAEAWAVPSSPTPTPAPTSPVTASTPSSFDVWQISAVCPLSLHRLQSLSVQLASTRAVGQYMAFRATPVSPHHWGTTFGGFGAAAMATGSRGRATTDLTGAYTTSFRAFPDVRLFHCRCLHLCRGRPRHGA